jgi:predicted dinucleotide-binding enzyme
VRVATVGRGRLGGGLAGLWRAAGHEVVEIGREGGDVSGCDAVLLAVPSGAVGDALAALSGLGQTPVIDATNPVQTPRPDGFGSVSDYVRSVTGGPVAKAFNTNFAAIFDRLEEAGARPSMVYAADEGARAVTEALIEAVGYEPVSAGDLTAARAIEDFIAVIFAVSSERGAFFYRIY